MCLPVTQGGGATRLGVACLRRLAVSVKWPVAVFPVAPRGTASGWAAPLGVPCTAFALGRTPQACRGPPRSGEGRAGAVNTPGCAVKGAPREPPLHPGARLSVLLRLGRGQDQDRPSGDAPCGSPRWVSVWTVEITPWPSSTAVAPSHRAPLAADRADIARPQAGAAPSHHGLPF